MTASKTIIERNYIENYLKKENLSLFRNKGGFIAATILFGIVFLVISVWPSTLIDARIIAIIIVLCSVTTVICTVKSGKYIFFAKLAGILLMSGVYLEIAHSVLSDNNLGYLMKTVYVGAGLMFVTMLVVYIVKGLYVKTGLKGNVKIKKYGASTWIPMGIITGGIGYYIATVASKEEQRAFAIIFTIFSLLCLLLFSFYLIDFIAKYYLIVKYDMDSLIREKIENDKEIINTEQ